MKSFVISLLAFALIIGAIAASSIYIRGVARELGDMVENFTPTDKEGFSRAMDFWEKNERIICIFVSHKDIDNVNLAFEVLEEKINNDDGGGFYEYRALLQKYIEEIGNKERLHIDNII